MFQTIVMICCRLDYLFITKGLVDSRFAGAIFIKLERPREAHCQQVAFLHIQGQGARDEFAGKGGRAIYR